MEQQTEVEIKIGRKTEVEASRIIDAASKLAESGKPVSGWKLRNLVGAGNPDRLMRVWEEYLSKNGNIPIVSEQSEENSLLPPDVEDSMRLALGTLNQHIEEMVVRANNAAVRAADKRVASEYNASKQAKEQAEQELSEAELALTHADDKAEELQIKTYELEELYRKTSGELQSSKASNKSLEKQQVELTSERDDFENRCNKQALEITENKVVIGIASNEREQLGKEVQEHKSKYKQITQKLVDAEKKIVEVGLELSKTSGVLESSKIDVANKTKQLDELNVKYISNLSEQAEQIGELKVQKESADLKVNMAENKFQEFKGKLVEVQCQTKALTEEHEKEINSLTEQLERTIKKK